MCKINYKNQLQKQKEILENEGYSVAYICLYGSQNYNLDINTEEYQSDVDMKAVIVPTLRDLINNSKPVSEVVDTEWGQCDIKDIRMYFKTLLKGNPAYIETIFTDHYIIDNKFIDEFNDILNKREKLVEALRLQMLRAMYGMMKEKEKALTHPYPTIKHKIDKFGYCGKQSHHILRLYLMIGDYFMSSKSMKDSLVPDKKQYDELMSHKLNEPSLKEAKEDVNRWMDNAKQIKDHILGITDESRIDYSIKKEFVKLSHSIIENKIIEEIKSK